MEKDTNATDITESDRLRELMENPKNLPSVKDFLDAFPEGERMNWLLYNDNFYKTMGYEILTEEYVDDLSKYLSTRVDEIFNQTKQKVTILEVGGGSGRLSKFLSEKLQDVDADKFQIICTDVSKPDEEAMLFPVEEFGFEAAVLKYDPQVVINSWMPAGMDWTPAFRNNQNVWEYILIGVGKGRTGNEDAYIEKDGFTKDEICKESVQLCVEDDPFLVIGRQKEKSSKTFSFRRQTA